MKTFIIIWFGQLISRVGTAMTKFGFLVWVYQQTGLATDVALLGFFAFLPYLLISPFAGVWIDRLDRRKVMIYSDLGAGLMTIILFRLLATGNLEIWHIYVAEGMAGFFEAFQIPAYTAVTTTIMPKAQYSRANGMRLMASYGAQILAPLFAGSLLMFIGLRGIMLIDMSTFLIAIGTLLVVTLPKLPRAEGTEEKPTFWDDMRVGVRYIRARPGLMGLLAIFMGINFFASLTYFSIMPAMLLDRSGNNEVVLAWVQGTLGGAGVVGSICMTIWGLPKKKIHAVLAGGAVSFLFGDLLFAIGQSTIVWIIAAAIAAFFIPFISGANRTIWQEKVPPELQGRVFGTQQTVQELLMPLGYLLGGVLADRVLEPAMMTDGQLAPILGSLVGTGAGAGMGVMFLVTAVLGCLISLSGYLIKPVRQIEADS
ncbi:MAG: MFS transporter [Chloroflexota bacterium]